MLAFCKSLLLDVFLMLTLSAVVRPLLASTLREIFSTLLGSNQPKGPFCLSTASGDKDRSR